MATTSPCQCSLKLNSFNSFYIGDKFFAGPTGAYTNTIYFNGQGTITFDSRFGMYYAYDAEYPNFKYEFQIIENNVVIQTTGEFLANIFTYTYNGKTEYTIPYKTISLIDPYKDGRMFQLRVIVKVNGTVYFNKTFNIPSVPVPSAISYVCPSSMETGKVYSYSFSGLNLATDFTLMQIRLSYYKNGSSYGETTLGYTSNGESIYQISNYRNNERSGKIYPAFSSGKAHDSNAGLLLLYLSYSGSNSETSSVGNLTINIEQDITFSYVNQVSSDAAPSISGLSIVGTPSNILATYGGYLGGGISKLKFNATVTKKYGYGISSIVLSFYNASNNTLVHSYSYTYEQLSNMEVTLQDITDIQYYVIISAITSQNVAGNAQYSTFLVYGYQAPSIIVFTASRCNQDGTPNDMGEYCIISYQFKVSPIGNQNSKTVTLSAPDGNHVYTNLDYDHGSPYQYISSANTESSYALSLIVQDDIQFVSMSRNISTAGVIMDFLRDGKGIGLGKVAETTKMVEVNPEWTFKADKMTFKGQDLETILTSLGYVFPT